MDRPLAIVGTRRRRVARLVGLALAGGASVVATLVSAPNTVDAALGTVPAGWVVRVAVPDAIGGKTVIGQLTVDRAAVPGFVTAYGCDDGMPTNANGGISRSDVNYDGRVMPAASNRLIVQADAAGDVCFYTSARVDLIVDVNGVSFDSGISSFPNRRTDTRAASGVPQVSSGGIVRVAIPEAVGGKTVIGQLAVDRAATIGYVTAYGCDDLAAQPRIADTRSDLNYDGRVTPAASNRLIVQADADGEVCLRASSPVDMIVDINGTTDVGIGSFTNRRTDTRSRTTLAPQVAANGIVRIAVPEAVGAKTVIGQLTVDRAAGWGYVTAAGCDDLASDPGLGNSRSDLNYEGQITRAASNRLIVQADADGEICLRTTSPTDVIVDVNAVAGAGIVSFPNQRTDTRAGATALELPGIGEIPTWPPFTPRPPLDGLAALTGEPVSADMTRRPIVAVKIDNYRLARPQWGLDLADAVIELNVEGVTRFVALFQTDLPAVGPVRSARTSDLDLLFAMNRPAFGYSGANTGVDAWIRSAAGSGLLVDFSAQRNGCYVRVPDRPGPHNLSFDISCAAAQATSAGPARPLWDILAAWVPPTGVTFLADTSFTVPMDGVRVEWTWDAATGQYLRSQDGAEHLAGSGARIVARNVVVLSTQHVPSPVDARSPNPITVGTGVGVVHRAGRAIPVTWSRATAYDPFVFRHTATGAIVPLDVGVTFMELTREA
jgi:hypothetical protein